MTYRFTGKDKNDNPVEPLNGLPIEASDRDFSERLREREAIEGEGYAQAVRSSGIYEHVSDSKAASAAEEA